MKNLILIIGLFLSNSLLAQNNFVKGIVIGENNTPLDYVNIGVVGTSVGTVSGAQGEFELYFNEKINGGDTVRFSSIGFASQDFNVEELLSKDMLTIQLKTQSTTLKEIVVLPDFLRTKEKGNKNTNARMNVYYAISKKSNQNLGAEIGRKFKIKKPTQLKKVRFFIAQNNFDTVRFRINVYHLKKRKPGTNILSQNIIKEVVGQQQGWIEVDLTPYQIYTEKNVVVGVEWIYHSQKGKYLTLPISVPSVGSVHFYKYGSQNKWKRFNVMSAAIRVEMAY